MELIELWHYPRPGLARDYLSVLDSGLVVSTTIFAPRRTGKTQFLRRDLTPAAERAGYCVVYSDLWQVSSSLGEALLAPLREALEPDTVGARLAARLKAPIKAVGARAEVAGARIEGTVQLDDHKKSAPADLALALDAAIGELVRRRPLLLLVDEAQALARSQAGEALARALRTAMTKHARRIRVVFTGSSRTQLGHVFSNGSAPLYSAGATVQDFPLLGQQFISYILRRFRESTKRDIDPKDAWSAFEAFGFRPEPFLQSVLAVMLNPRLEFARAVEQVNEALARHENHEGVWQSLDATERALARRIADDAGLKPFAKPVVAALRRELGLSELRQTHIQKALQRLADKNVVSRTPRAVYEFENEGFEAWLRAQKT